MAEQVEMKAKVVQSEVKAVTARHKKALEERECELLWKVMEVPTPPWAASVNHSRMARSLMSHLGPLL